VVRYARLINAMFTLNELVEEIGYPTGGRTRGDTFGGHSTPKPVVNEVWGKSGEKTYCPACVKNRYFSIEILKGTGTLTRLCRKRPFTGDGRFDTDEFGPSLLQYKCENCFLIINAMIYDGSEGPAIASFPVANGGLATPNTPDSVSFFLNQAFKCVSIDAKAAAVAMFRVALEQLLLENGFGENCGLLDGKIAALEALKTTNTPPDWIVDLDSELLTNMRKLGNLSAHPKSLVEIKNLDSRTLEGAVELFQYLLAEIYERPKNDEKLLSKLKNTRNKI
jgi:hypothetical protein